MLEDHITVTNNHEYKKDTSNIKFSQTIPGKFSIEVQKFEGFQAL